MVKIKSILGDIEHFLESYDPLRLIYLDRSGVWRTDPRTIGDRVSNELWHLLWQNRQNRVWREYISEIIEPFLNDRSLRGMFASLIPDKGVAATTTAILAIVARFIQYQAYKKNSEAYVSEWDLPGQELRAEYILAVSQCVRDMFKEATGVVSIDATFSLINTVRERSFLFGTVTDVIADEDRIVRQMERIVENWSEDHAGNTALALASSIPRTIESYVKDARALLRPCITILNDHTIPVATGISYEAVHILGALADSRSYRSLKSALDHFGYEYANIRCALVYALGRLRQPLAAKTFMEILDGPAYVPVIQHGSGRLYKQTLSWEKREAIWALGNLEGCALDGVEKIIAYAENHHPDIKRVLAWALGRIGSAQRETYHGVDANIVIALLRMLQQGDIKTFEESAYSLRNLGFPDVLNTIYVHNVNVLPLLTMKPSRSGLYELSETLYHLAAVKRPVVMAVSGDSGTGKTYFCESIKDGFGGFAPQEILYLMRDNPGHMSMFRRMLGLKLLQRFFDPEFYQDYPLGEADDDPVAYFNDFIDYNKTKKLIVLDGWLDRGYFYQVLKTFHAMGYLDIVVNFRTTYSTRRKNLECREGLLENVLKCLDYVENPALEETEYYRSGDVLIYNLDNSHGSRLSRNEIRELFSKQKVKTWDRYLRIGEFDDMEICEHKVTKQLHATEVTLLTTTYDFSFNTPHAIDVDEIRYTRTLSVDAEREPFLLQMVDTNPVDAHCLAFYTHGQIASGGADGTLALLSGIDDRAFFARIHRTPVKYIAVVGEQLCSLDTQGELALTSFNDRQTRMLYSGVPCSGVLASGYGHYIISGHDDGSVRVHDLERCTTTCCNCSTRPVSAIRMVSTHVCAIVQGYEDVCIWDMNKGSAKIVTDLPIKAEAMDLYPDGKLVAAGPRNDDGSKIGIVFIVLSDGSLTYYDIKDCTRVRCMVSYNDGRIILGFSQHSGDAVVVFDPRDNEGTYKKIGSYGYAMHSCIVMGPRIITSGCDYPKRPMIKIYGAKDYVRAEREKLSLLPGNVTKPAYYRTQF